MPKQGSGGGRVASPRELAARSRYFQLDTPPAVDLNRAPFKELAAHPLIGKSLAAAIARRRKSRRLAGAADLYHAGLISAGQLAALERASFGTRMLAPRITRIRPSPGALYVDEPFSLVVEFARNTPLVPELVSLDVRFPSGRTGRAHFRISAQARRAGRLRLGPFTSGQSGELIVRATLRAANGTTQVSTTTLPVFTRNPVRMFITPTHWTQSGTVGATRFDFTQRRWYCEAAVRWVNSEDRQVNLGRTVRVRMTDVGTEIGSFSFDLSGDIVIPARSTIYGSLYTYHSEGSAAFNVFHNKGDLTFEYSMSGGGFTPTARQIWRTMRVIGYNIVRVGDFTGAERNEYRRAAAEVASGIFQSRDLTVFGVELYRIEGTRNQDADKERWRFIDSQDEARDMWDKYTVSNWYLDVFFVEGIWDGSYGFSPVNGPVDKRGRKSGLVIRRDGDTLNLGQTFAHEAGHHLGLEHADEDDGCADTDPADPHISDNFIYSSSRSDSYVITTCQINKLQRHGLVRSMTP